MGGIDSVYYVPEYLSEAEEAQVAAQLRASPEAMWQPMHGRRVQECGSAMAARWRALRALAASMETGARRSVGGDCSVACT